MDVLDGFRIFRAGVGWSELKLSNESQPILKVCLSFTQEDPIQLQFLRRA